MAFRKRKKIAKGMHLNLSGRGIGFGYKLFPGLSFSINRNGVYCNTSIPGSGFYSRNKILGNQSTRKNSQGNNTSALSSFQPRERFTTEVEIHVHAENDGSYTTHIYDLEGNETKAFPSNAAMGSVDRLGTTRLTGSYNFLTEVLRNEWGFKGSIITDYYQSGNVNDVDEGIRSGNDLMLNGARNCTLDDTSSNTYKYYIRQAAKNILYTYADTKYCQATASGLDIGSVVTDKVNVDAWWIRVLALVDAVLVIDIIAGLYFTWSPVIFKKSKVKGA